jgi:hypothetical protein
LCVEMMTPAPSRAMVSPAKGSFVVVSNERRRCYWRPWIEEKHPVNRPHQSAKGAGLATRRASPVELDAARVARPDRWRLVGVILWSSLTLSVRDALRRVIPTFYPMRDAPGNGRQGQTSPPVYTGAGLSWPKAGACPSGRQSRRRGSGCGRAQGTSCPLNAAGVGSFRPGDGVESVL